jgi:RES domain-containing protein
MLRTPKPGMLAAYTVDIADMIDLTDPNTLSSLGIDNKTFECPWKILRARGAPIPTWDLAERLIADGVAGARVPSFAAAGGINVVLWNWQTPPNVANVSDPDGDLPKNQSSWA